SAQRSQDFGAATQPSGSKLPRHNKRPYLIVPTLCVGMHPVTLRVTTLKRTRSVQGGIPTRSVGTI
ncbi:hypothetical protein C1X81_32775, partial [Pseudomonas sp. FW215-L2]